MMTASEQLELRRMLRASGLLTDTNVGVFASALPIPPPRAGTALIQFKADVASIDTTEVLRAYLDRIIALASGPSRRQLVAFRDAVTSDATGATLAEDIHDTERKQAIVFSDDMVDVAFLSLGLAALPAVGRIVVPRFLGGNPQAEPAYGTAWLVNSQHVLTCLHVLHARRGEATAPSVDLERQWKASHVQFGYVDDTSLGDSVAVADLVASDAALDFALLKLATPQKHPGLSLSQHLPLPPTEEHGAAVVNIIQHPNGKGKRLAMRNNAVSGWDDKDLRYFTDTKSGSSGAPVLDDRFRVVALHRAIRWTDGLKYLGKAVGYINAGTRINRIIDALDGIVSLDVVD